ncbi:MAG TPA: amino acid permease [Vicinamibacterales bacterium]|nr:amino acid permease [Vicinamibacterales bacterium]
MSIFATKPIEQIEAEQLGSGEATLKRVLGPSQLILLGVGAIIGTGIFVLTGQAAAANAGPAIVLSMVLAGLTSVLAALCYSEFAASVPVAGSAYTYAYATLGEFIAWVIGWDLILEYALGAATVAVGWSGNLVTLLNQLGIAFPAAVSAAPGTVVQLAGGGMATGTVTAVFNLPAVLITIAVTMLLVIGVSESATVNAVIVVIKVAVVLIVIGAGAMFIEPANWHPFIPPNTGRFGEYGWSGVLRGAGVIFFAYIGFDAVSTSAQEARDPQRDMPRGILGSLAVCTVLFVLVSGVMVGIVPYRQMLNQPAPLVVAIAAAAGRAAGTPWAPVMNALQLLLTVGALAALSSVMVVMMLAQPRIFLAMAKDGLLPAWAARVHPRFRTPHVSTIVTGIAVSIASGLTPIGTLGSLVSIGTLMAFVIVSIGIIVLRKTRPDLPRPFRMPLVPLLPILSALVAFVLMLGLPRATWERLILWMAVGIVIYFTYGYRRSHLRGEAARALATGEV